VHKDRTRLFDIVLQNCVVIDGTGRRRFKADIGIQGKRIARIGRLRNEPADRRLDLKGLAVAPGFIDMHSHSDLSLLVNPRAESKVRQGVTTEVIGNCGASAAPLTGLVRDDIRNTWPEVRDGGLRLNWSTMCEYLERIRRAGIALNIVPLVGHGNIRACVMGFERRAPRKAEMSRMIQILRESLDEGAAGMSSGLIYPPGCYSETPELVQLTKVVAKHGGIYTSHIRNEGERLLEAVAEAIEIGRRAGVSVEISHHKATGQANWGMVKHSLRKIREARSGGINVACDVYPYTAGSFGLSSMLPTWAYEGGVKALVKRLKKAETRRQIEEEMEHERSQGEGALAAAGWDQTMIARCRSHPRYEGRMVERIASEMRKDLYELVFNLLQLEPSISVVRFMMDEKDVRHVMSRPYTMVGSDSSAAAPYGPLGRGKPHPRGYGTFPRVLARYVREERALTLEKAVMKMSRLPAAKLGLRKRGRIAPGMYADLVVFNPSTVIDRATYQQPHRYPTGIEYVIVNGVIVIARGRHSGLLPGEALSAPQCAEPS